MKVHALGPHRLHLGDCVDFMRSLPAATFHACVTDPPYGIGFMGRAWDCDTPGGDFAAELLRSLKPGAHAVLFAATRTLHRLTCALEDAGFEIRDVIHWCYFSGFPKSIDRALLPDGWQGWGTALKPAVEPAILVRKPLAGTVAANLLAHGCGALNIDAARFAFGDPCWVGPAGKSGPRDNKSARSHSVTVHLPPVSLDPHPLGRWPANLYYCPKPSTAEREAGCEHLAQRTGPELVYREPGSAGLDNPRAGAGRTAEARGNHHPTVKPAALMRWLLRLVTPPGGRVLEPFAGSGSTLVGAHGLDMTIDAIEREPEYCEIARARWAHADRQILLPLG